ncbi:MAG: flagellar biosynthetic protein FliO, partial [Actinomycetota bacterium]|nr:flagellar biosynthetic protein FliO [Actinomycetota bacterium]
MKDFLKFNNLDKSSNFQGLSFLNKSNNLQESNGNTLKKKLKPVLIFFALFFLSIIFLYTFNSKQSATDQMGISQSSNQLSGFDLILKFIIGLAIVSILIYITVYILKYFYSRKQKTGTASKSFSSGIINMLESMSIDNNKKLYLIKIADKVLLLSSSENQINLITELKEEEVKKESITVMEGTNHEDNKSF